MINIVTLPMGVHTTHFDRVSFTEIPRKNVLLQPMSHKRNMPDVPDVIKILTTPSEKQRKKVKD